MVFHVKISHAPHIKAWGSIIHNSHMEAWEKHGESAHASHMKAWGSISHK